MTSFKEKLNQMFKVLRKEGLIARQNFMCCQTCAGAKIYPAVIEKHAFGYCFYHSQDAENITENRGVHLSFGAHIDNLNLQVGDLIRNVANEVGLTVEWSGKVEQRIFVKE